mmetsp:Transcript_32045/g.48324  ORF Transcript_32045/g.48324 Transcript_32045/m.48324 type:complete len:174 (+) Transcript_32045:66-587(+)
MALKYLLLCSVASSSLGFELPLLEATTTRSPAKLRGTREDPVASYADMVAEEVEPTTRCEGAELQSKFQGAISTCAMETGGFQPAAGVCMTKKLEVSDGCGRCMGDFLQCGHTQCAAACCLGQCGDEPKCTSCLEEACTPEFSNCDRLDPSERHRHMSFADAFMESGAMLEFA